MLGLGPLGLLLTRVLKSRGAAHAIGYSHEHALHHEVLTSRYVTHTVPVLDAERAYRMHATPAVGRLKVALTPPE